MSDNEKAMAQRFQRETAGHEMTVLHDDGLYRHLRFVNPESSCYWFEVVTWPGSLAIRGDVDGLVFARITDMFEFFRGKHINPGYWAEKTPDCGTSLKEYSEDVLKAEVESHLADYERDEYPDLLDEYKKAKAEFDSLTYMQRLQRGRTAEPVAPASPADLRALVARYEAEGELAHEEGARDLLSELETAGVVSDTWEWDLAEWKWSYLWCCHAIVWAVAQYDAANPAATEAVTS